MKYHNIQIFHFLEQFHKEQIKMSQQYNNQGCPPTYQAATNIPAGTDYSQNQIKGPYITPNGQYLQNPNLYPVQAPANYATTTAYVNPNPNQTTVVYQTRVVYDPLRMRRVRRIRLFSFLFVLLFIIIFNSVFFSSYYNY